ncbi:MAG: hypothetical protein LUB61_01945, partial [Eggerthellaceae bacterium]|nr:hypothetical protein [Eggerthellaceae bacterium]
DAVSDGTGLLQTTQVTSIDKDDTIGATGGQLADDSEEIQGSDKHIEGLLSGEGSEEDADDASQDTTPSETLPADTEEEAAPSPESTPEPEADITHTTPDASSGTSAYAGASDAQAQTITVSVAIDGSRADS